MIVRILGEGQYDVADDALARLNSIDNDLGVAVESGDEAAFAAALTALHDGVRAAGTAHAPDSLDESDVILPKTTMRDLARRPPSTVDDLAHIADFGPWRRATYGAEILALLATAPAQA